jgi:hypothetical protein
MPPIVNKLCMCRVSQLIPRHLCPSANLASDHPCRSPPPPSLSFLQGVKGMKVGEERKLIIPSSVRTHHTRTLTHVHRCLPRIVLSILAAGARSCTIVPHLLLLPPLPPPFPPYLSSLRLSRYPSSPTARPAPPAAPSPPTPSSPSVSSSSRSSKLEQTINVRSQWSRRFFSFTQYPIKVPRSFSCGFRCGLLTVDGLT